MRDDAPSSLAPLCAMPDDLLRLAIFSKKMSTFYIDRLLYDETLRKRSLAGRVLR